MDGKEQLVRASALRLSYTQSCCPCAATLLRRGFERGSLARSRARPRRRRCADQQLIYYAGRAHSQPHTSFQAAISRLLSARLLCLCLPFLEQNAEFSPCSCRLRVSAATRLLRCHKKYASTLEAMRLLGCAAPLRWQLVAE